jgi:hypothetical protein
VRAVGERITVTAVGRIKDFTQTIRTGGDVRQDERGFAAAGFAGANFKVFIADGIEPRRFQTLNKTARRYFGFKRELLTHPASRISSASRKTNGRNPTPCTAPRTVIFRRAAEAEAVGCCWQKAMTVINWFHPDQRNDRSLK